MCCELQGFQALLQRYLEGDFTLPSVQPPQPQKQSALVAARHLFVLGTQSGDKQRAFVRKALSDVCRFMLAHNTHNLNVRDQHGMHAAAASDHLLFCWLVCVLLLIEQQLTF